MIYKEIMRSVNYVSYTIYKYMRAVDKKDAEIERVSEKLRKIGNLIDMDAVFDCEDPSTHETMSTFLELVQEQHKQQHEQNIILEELNALLKTYTEDMQGREEELKRVLVKNALQLYNAKEPAEAALQSKPEERLCPVCNAPPDDNMVACDNSECVGGWYHLLCTDLDAIPEDEWFCPKCTER